MKWNRLNKLGGGTFLQNPFGSRLFPDEQRRWERALGRDKKANDRDIGRFSRDDKGGKVGDPFFYQENLKEDREHCEDVLHLMASRLGVPVSMVVHGVITGRRDRLAVAVRNWLDNSVTYRKDHIMVDGVKVPVQVAYFDPARVPGVEYTVWNGKTIENIFAENSDEPTNWEATVTSVWDWATGSKDQKQRDREAQREIALAEAAVEGAKVQARVKGNAQKGTKGVQVINAKQGKRKQVKA